MNETARSTFANVVLKTHFYRSSFMNMFVHVLSMFRWFVNDFYRFRFYRSSSHERTK